MPEPTHDTNPAEASAPMKRWFWAVPAGWGAALLLLWIVEGHTGTVRTFGLAIPSDVLWFGAVGGVTSSLHGMFLNSGRWNTSYNGWHFAAPVVGSIYGLVAYLILVAIGKTTGSGSSDPGSAAFALGAFTLGFTQSQFSALIHRVFDVLFVPAGQAAQTKD